MAARIILADDHQLMRQGIRSLLEHENGIEVVGEASSAREAIQRVEDLKPDVVLMDISMTDISGIEATRVIKERHPDAKIIALTMHADMYFMMLFKSAGGDGYILKNQPIEDIREAIAKVMAGQDAFPAEVT